MDYLATGQLSRHASPIWAMEIHPLKTGTSELELVFHHAAYSDGVQEKRYRLRLLRRTPALVLAEVCDTAAPHPIVVITEIAADWITLHWPHYSPEGDLQSWCDEVIGRPGHPARSR